jgi:purine-binding chemotaxis protein CheW
VAYDTGTKTTLPAKIDKYLSFYLGKEEFAISISSVKEIIGVQEITHVPQMPPYVEGFLNLRGKVIPVVNMRTKCGLPEVKRGPQTCIIVVQLTRDAVALPMGIIVDGVSEVTNVSASDVEHMPEFGGAGTRPYLMGVAKLKDRAKIHIDINLILSSRETVALPGA